MKPGLPVLRPHYPQGVPLLFGLDGGSSLKRVARASRDDVVTDTLAVSRVPAPTGSEARRARLVRDLFRRDDPGRLVYLDQVGNVVTRIAGRQRERSIIVAAHLDTVFHADQVHDPRIEHGRLVGPGVGDNGVALAAMVAMPRVLAAAGTILACDVVLVGTVGEEGYGNLRGIEAALNMHRDAEAVVAVEGHGLGRITHVAVGSRRLAVQIAGPGGHSWADHGRPSAVHAAGELIARLAAIPLPDWPRTSLNVGSITGGTAINAIAPTATLHLEVRSVDALVLDHTVDEIYRQIRLVERNGLRASVESLGTRPAGSLPKDHLIVRRARAVLSSLGVPSASDASSTDANVPLASGVPAICVGISIGGQAHTPNEWIDVEPIGNGVAQLAVLVRDLADDVAAGRLRRTGYLADPVQPTAAASD